MKRSTKWRCSGRRGAWIRDHFADKIVEIDEKNVIWATDGANACVFSKFANQKCPKRKAHRGVRMLIYGAFKHCDSVPFSELMQAQKKVALCRLTHVKSESYILAAK